jgi:hypothetical protein
LQSCSDKNNQSEEQPVRGLRAHKVSASAESRVRRFPSVHPADLSLLSFEIAGRPEGHQSGSGQEPIGDLLAEIDPRSLQAQVEQAAPVQ